MKFLSPQGERSGEGWCDSAPRTSHSALVVIGERDSRTTMKARVAIYDTTLRDGSQAEDLNFSVEDKIRVCRKLDELGVHYIEGGWPGSKDRKSTRLNS